MSFITGTSTELIYTNPTSGTAKASFTTEIAINDTTGMGPLAHLPPDFWATTNNGTLRGIEIIARGIASTTGTPTYTFTCRLGAAASVTSAIALGSAALTTGSGIANAIWEFNGHFFLRTFGAAGANSTGMGIGILSSFGTANKIDPIWGGGASPGTVATVDTSITNYINFNVACSASSPSNTITLLQLIVVGLN